MELALAVIVVMAISLRCSFIYKLEGDGLCVLRKHGKEEELRSLGGESDADQSRLPNTSAVLRARANLEAGVKNHQY